MDDDMASKFPACAAMIAKPPSTYHDAPSLECIKEVVAIVDTAASIMQSKKFGKIPENMFNKDMVARSKSLASFVDDITSNMELMRYISFGKHQSLHARDIKT